MEIFKIFRSAANPEKAASMCAYMRSRFPYLGIQAPERKKLGRDYPNWVCNFIEKHRNEMASLSIREASKYI